ncbi:hypothetical protein P9112_001826 [Eukaryota sp. TZLM1-RC]
MQRGSLSLVGRSIKTPAGGLARSSSSHNYSFPAARSSRPLSASVTSKISNPKLHRSRPHSSLPRLENTSKSDLFLIGKSNPSRSLSPSEQLLFQSIRSRVLSSNSTSPTPTPTSSPPHEPPTPPLSPSETTPTRGCGGKAHHKLAISTDTSPLKDDSQPSSPLPQSKASSQLSHLITNTVNTGLFGSFDDVFNDLLGIDENDPDVNCIDLMFLKIRKSMPLRLKRQ